jgi:uncharacterized membrane protein
VPALPAWSDLHPFLVHFPIALLAVAPVFLIWGSLRLPSAAGAARAGILLTVAGTLTLLLAFSSGEAGRGRVPRTEAVQEELAEHTEHGGLARIAMVIATVGLLALHVRGGLARSGRVATGIRIALFLVYGFGLFQVLDAAHHGGRLVHVHGVHVDMDW